MAPSSESFALFHQAHGQFLKVFTDRGDLKEGPVVYGSGWLMFVNAKPGCGILRQSS